ncbi:MAG: hypothetical protein ABIL68_11380 [bacterium]
MVVQLENLIEKIKKEGVEEAKQLADKIVKNAKKEADSIVANAKKEADKILEEAGREIAHSRKNAELAIQQAARDAELLMKENFTALFDRIFKREVAGTMTPEFMKKLLLMIVEKWAKKSDVEILVGEKEKDDLEKMLFKGVQKELKNTITFKPSSDVDRGFRIGLKGENVYYDFSEGSIAEMLKQFINPRLNAILEKKNG